MKILKPGTTEHKRTCTGTGNDGGGCGAVLLVSRGDLFRTSRHCYGDEYPEYFITFKCPQCAVLTDTKFPGVHHVDLPSRAEWEQSCGVVDKVPSGE